MKKKKSILIAIFWNKGMKKNSMLYDKYIGI